MKLLWVMALAASTAFACSNGTGTGADAGSGADAGRTPDAGGSADAGVPTPTNGPLRAGPNPHYLFDAAGKAVLLTGTHTWDTLQDTSQASPPPSFDFAGYV